MYFELFWSSLLRENMTTSQQLKSLNRVFFETAQKWKKKQARRTRQPGARTRCFNFVIWRFWSWLAWKISMLERSIFYIDMIKCPIILGFHKFSYSFRPIKNTNWEKSTESWVDAPQIPHWWHCLIIGEAKHTNRWSRPSCWLNSLHLCRHSIREKGSTMIKLRSCRQQMCSLLLSLGDANVIGNCNLKPF